MNIEDYKFDDVLDVVICLNSELMQRTFANNLVDVCNNVYELSGEKLAVLCWRNRRKNISMLTQIL